jgi:biotin carboxyl carrier protein
MQDEIHFDDILRGYREDPFDYHAVSTPHTGIIRFKVSTGESVEGTTGEWRHIPGTLLYYLERERNVKPISSTTNGIVSEMNNAFDGKFVEAGEKIMTIKHPLKKREIIDSILKKVLYMFEAPERAKYFFSLEIQSRIEKFGQRAVSVKKGDEILTMSLMKRDTPVYYEGEPGIIHSVYFQPGDSIEQGKAMIGICPKEKLPLIEKIITRVRAEWE